MTGGTILAASRWPLPPRPCSTSAEASTTRSPNHGEGFCLFNDVAVALRLLLDAGSLARAAVIDLDVHHGNGTAFIFEHEPRVFTFSMHQQHNYPAFKPRGSFDVGLPDAVGDEAVPRAPRGEPASGLRESA